MKIAIGHSEDSDTSFAVKEIISQCKAVLGDEKPKGGLVFASVSYDYPVLLDEINAAFLGVQLAGCSSYGEISSIIGGLSEDSVALFLISGDEIEVRSGMVKNISENGQTEMYKTLKETFEGATKKASFGCLFADGMKGNVSDTIVGMQNFFGEYFPIAGGSACDDWKFKEVYQFCGNEIQTNAASFLVFSEPLKTSMAVFHGRRPFPSTGKHLITKSNRNIVYTIDNMTALEFYRSTIGKISGYEPYALLIHQKDKDKYLIRSPFKINEEDGSIVFAADVPENAYIDISKLSTHEDTLEAATSCVKEALKSFTGKKIEAALVFSCALRKEVLGTETHIELELIKAQLPKDTPIFGFYTFGEIGPFNKDYPTYFHNETIVVALIGE